MMFSMTTKAKIAVTLPRELVESARAAVAAGRSGSVSAYVADALREKTERDELEELLAELLTDSGGQLTDREREEVDGMLGWQ